MILTEKEYKILLEVNEKTKVQMLLKKHLDFEKKVEELMGLAFVDKIWEEIKNA